MCKPLLWESSLNDVTQFLIFPQSLTEHIVLSLNFLIVSIENLKKDSKELLNKGPIRNKLRILLMDEPDAYLHPSLIKQIINMFLTK